VSTVLQSEDRDAVAERFGADDTQIARDHLISHLLAGLAATVRDDVVFFGGTALSRTYLPVGRLSEDLDLYALGERREIAGVLTDRWPRTVRREYPRLAWGPSLRDVGELEPALLVSESGAMVRVQLLRADGTYRRWPTQIRQIESRYSDAPVAQLRVPTQQAFVAMKASAWRDRRAARDLFDLAALAELGAIDADAAALLRDVTGRPLVALDVAALPADLHWHEQLAHQCRLVLDAETALGRVRTAWAAIAGW
jgi:hypothetical protein